MEYINETEEAQKIVLHDNDTVFILLEIQAGQHCGTSCTNAIVVSGIEEAQALFPDKTIKDTTVEPERPVRSRPSLDEDE